MIRATSEQAIKNAFNGRIPFFECKEVDAYTGETTLFDLAETDDDITTTLLINGEHDFYVSVDHCGDICTEEQHNNIADAWNAYKRQAGDNTSGI